MTLLPPHLALLIAEAPPASFNYTIVFCGALALVAALIFFGVMVLRRPRRQRKRKTRFRRNPTLAETEGLPPVRGEAPPPTDPSPR